MEPPWLHWPHCGQHYKPDSVFGTVHRCLYSAEQKNCRFRRKKLNFSKLNMKWIRWWKICHCLTSWWPRGTIIGPSSDPVMTGWWDFSSPSLTFWLVKWKKSLLLSARYHFWHRKRQMESRDDVAEDFVETYLLNMRKKNVGESFEWEIINVSKWFPWIVVKATWFALSLISGWLVKKQQHWPWIGLLFICFSILT